MADGERWPELAILVRGEAPARLPPLRLVDLLTDPAYASDRATPSTPGEPGNR